MSAPFQALGSHAPIVPTKILGDPDELDRHLVHSMPETYNMRHVQGDNAYDNGYMYSQDSDVEMHVSGAMGSIVKIADHLTNKAAPSLNEESRFPWLRTCSLRSVRLSFAH